MRDGAFTCSICGRKSTGYLNNAEPVVKKGWCCDDCNIRTVMPARIRQMMASGPQTRQGLQTR